LEQLQTAEKEVRSLEASQKKLAALRDHRDGRKIERSELHLKEEVCSLYTSSSSNAHVILKRVQKQLYNAAEKLERVQRHAEDKRSASQRTLERLHREYDEMVDERKENDKELEELRAEAEEFETKVR
jgi:kinetochore protein Nuf2